MSSDWPIVQLSECASFQEGYVNPTQKKPEYFDGEIKWLRAVDLNNGFVKTTTRTLSKEGFESAGKSALLFEPGTLAISKSGTIGRLGILQDYMCGNRAVINIRVDTEKCNNLFIFYVLIFNRPIVENLAIGSVQKNLYTSALGKLEFTLPPRPSQDAIAKILSSLDNKIELNRQTNQTLEKIAQAIFKSWFVDFEPTRAKIIAQDMGADSATQELAAQAIICGALTLEQLADIEQNLATTLREAIHTKLSHNSPTPINAEQLATTAALFPNALVESELGEIPEGWAVKPFSDWVTVTKGKSITRAKAVPGDIPVVAGGREPAYYHNEFNVEGPAITISASGANAGYVNLYRQNIWSSDSSYINKQTTPYFYTAYTFLKYRQKAIFDMQTGAAQPHIYPRDFERLYVVVANDSLLSIFEKQLVSYFECSFSLEEESITLAELRDTLLPKLLSGELDVSALADDSAPAIKTKEAFDV